MIAREQTHAHHVTWGVQTPFARKRDKHEQLFSGESEERFSPKKNDIRVARIASFVDL